MLTAGVIIKDTPSEFGPKNKTPTKVVRGKGMDLLYDVALLEAAQLKKTLKKSKLKTHKLHESGSGDGVGSQPKVLDEQEDKTTGTYKGTSTKPRFPDVPKYQSETKNESWGNSKDDDRNDDDSDEVTMDDDDDDGDHDVDGDNEASDSEKTDSDEDENLNLNQNDDEEEEYEEEYVCTPDSIEFTDDDKEYEELYKDVNVRLQATKHEEEGNGDEEMTNAGRDDGTQQTTYEQVKDDEHVILTIVHDKQKTEVPLQNKTISMRNRINLHTIRDDTLLGTLKFVSKTQDYQQYEALIPDEMINQDIKDSKAYKTYLDFAIGKATPKKSKNFTKFPSPSRKLALVLEKNL
nr:hypothetical protein [Tanacetum cinerariifolium]